MQGLSHGAWRRYCADTATAAAAALLARATDRLKPPQEISFLGVAATTAARGELLPLTAQPPGAARLLLMGDQMKCG